MVDQQQAVSDLDLVCVRFGWSGPLRYEARRRRIGHIQDRRTLPADAVVPYVQDVLVAHDLHPVAVSVKVVVADQPQPRRTHFLQGHRRPPPRSGLRVRVG